MLQLAYLLSCFATTFEVPQNNLYVPSDMKGHVRLIRDSDHTFKAIVNDQTEFAIKNYNVRGLPKEVSNEELKQIDCYFKLNQINDDAVLEVNGRLRGGGFWKDVWQVIKDGIVIVVGGGVKF